MRHIEEIAALCHDGGYCIRHCTPSRAGVARPLVWSGAMVTFCRRPDSDRCRVRRRGCTGAASEEHSSRTSSAAQPVGRVVWLIRNRCGSCGIWVVVHRTAAPDACLLGQSDEDTGRRRRVADGWENEIIRVDCRNFIASRRHCILGRLASCDADHMDVTRMDISGELLVTVAVPGGPLTAIFVVGAVEALQWPVAIRSLLLAVTLPFIIVPTASAIYLVMRARRRAAAIPSTLATEDVVSVKPY
jgi:hypothetical protein